MNFFIAARSDKKSIQQFYKAQKHSASLKGLDQVFLAKRDNTIVAALIISQIESSNTQYLLHGLVVDSNVRGQGIAKKLHHFSTQSLIEQRHKALDTIVCFANKSLSKLYCTLGYCVKPPEELNNTLLPRYTAYQKHQHGLVIFTRLLVAS